MDRREFCKLSIAAGITVALPAVALPIEKWPAWAFDAQRIANAAVRLLDEQIIETPDQRPAFPTHVGGLTRFCNDLPCKNGDVIHVGTRAYDLVLVNWCFEMEQASGMSWEEFEQVFLLPVAMSQHRLFARQHDAEALPCRELPLLPETQGFLVARAFQNNLSLRTTLSFDSLTQKTTCRIEGLFGIHDFERIAREDAART